MVRPWGVVAAVAAAAVGVVVARARPFRAEVAGDSMSPAVRPGEFLVAVRTARLRRGDVVVLRHPRAGFDVVKRLVGLPGEHVRTDGAAVWVNERRLVEPYASGRGSPGEWVLGPHRYLVLGDHRSRSTNGRAFGPVPRAAIEGRVVLRYWPRPGAVR